MKNANWTVLLVRLYFNGRMHPIEYRIPWAEQDEMPPSPIALVEEMQSEQFVDVDGRRISWDDSRCELLEVCVVDDEIEPTKIEPTEIPPGGTPRRIPPWPA